MVGGGLYNMGYTPNLLENAGGGSSFGDTGSSHSLVGFLFVGPDRFFKGE
jgi:hypothetical protein